MSSGLIPAPAQHHRTAFRHDPGRFTIGSAPAEGALSAAGIRWDAEPMVQGCRRLTHTAQNGARIPVPICATPVVTGAGVVVGSYDGRVRCFTPSLTEVQWEERLDSAIYASLVADPSHDRIIVAGVGGRVSCYDLQGELIWTTPTGLTLYASPVVLPAHDLIVLAGFGSRCTGLDLSTGQVRFERALPRPWHAAASGRAGVRDPYASPITTADGGIVLACAEHVICLDASGAERWIQEIGHAVRASPAVADSTGEVVVLSVDGWCRFLDQDSGAPVGAVRAPGKFTASPALSGDILAAATADGTTLGIDVRDRTIAWSRPSGGPRDHTSFSVLPSGDFIAVNTRGNVEAVTARTGEFCWETSQLMGLPGHDPALDTTPVSQASGWLYAGSYSGVLYSFRFRSPEVS